MPCSTALLSGAAGAAKYFSSSHLDVVRPLFPELFYFVLSSAMMLFTGSRPYSSEN